MLVELNIKNYLLVPELRLKFNAGLTVISGETGAGKSILVGSISLIMGDNLAGTEAYDKTQPIYLEAVFIPDTDPAIADFLVENGIAAEDELILAREINTSGKSSYYLNGRKVGASLLKELKPLLIDFHHQREQQRLLSPAFQLELLDAFAEAEPLRNEFADLYHKLKINLKRLAELHSESDRQKQLQELFQFQYEELEKVNLSSGEDETLQKEYELLSHGQEINSLCSELKYSLFEGENSVYDQIGTHLSQLGRFQQMDANLQKAADQLQQALEALQDASAHITRVGDNLFADPERIQSIQNRLDTINSLVHKHKVRSIAELLDLFAQRKQQISAFADLENSINLLETELETDFILLRQLADKLTAKRHLSGAQLCSLLQENIRRLSIPDGELEIRIDKKTPSSFILSEYIAVVSESGQDTVDFLFSANPGFAKKPLAAVVSGGELSRILLAIKKVLAQRIPPKLMILDEIDAGIGGKTADQVADFIYSLAMRQQVLCITHLAQIASRADNHFAIEKIAENGHTTLRLQRLDDNGRLQEIARMLSGSLGRKALEHANEILLEIKKRGNRG